MPLSCQFYLYDDKQRALEKYKTKINLKVESVHEDPKAVQHFDNVIRMETQVHGGNISKEYMTAMGFSHSSKR